MGLDDLVAVPTVPLKKKKKILSFSDIQVRILCSDYLFCSQIRATERMLTFIPQALNRTDSDLLMNIFLFFATGTWPLSCEAGSKTYSGYFL